jgi:2-polyprenyl-3-methyl-5-hydroxy-6-metoxy-1,4-benzoquinol methylase
MMPWQLRCMLTLKKLLLAATDRSPWLLALLSRLLPEHCPPAEQQHWNDEYVSGQWDWLWGIVEAPHNHVIAGYCRHLRPHAAVLDVGCGQGALHSILRTFGYRRYVGIDISPAAIAHASTSADQHTSFHATDARRFQTDEQFDLIVLNEVLYYFPEPLAAVSHLARFLSPDGFMTISMYQISFRDALRKQVLWRDIGLEFETVHKLSMSDGRGFGRIIKVLQPSRERVRQLGAGSPDLVRDQSPSLVAGSSMSEAATSQS